MSPYMLLQNNIPVVRCVQRPGEFIINYPGTMLTPMMIIMLTFCGVSQPMEDFVCMRSGPVV